MLILSHMKMHKIYTTDLSAMNQKANSVHLLTDPVIKHDKSG